MRKKYDPNRIEDALDLLESAARIKKDELKEQIGTKYSHIRNVFADEANGRFHQTKARMEEVVHAAEDRLEKLVHDGEKVAMQKARHLRKQVRANPAPFLGGVAVSALVLGYFLGHRGEGK